MAEVLGAVAAATQLAAMAMGLIDAVEKIKGVSKTLKKYQEQLIDIQRLSESISQNPLLQTPAVEVHIQSILTNISETNLENSLRRGWLFKVSILVLKEKDLIASFSTLDRQKLNLALAIDNIQAHALHQIQLNVQTMSSAARTEPTEKVYEPRETPSNRGTSNNKVKRSHSRSSAKKSTAPPATMQSLSSNEQDAKSLLTIEAMEQKILAHVSAGIDHGSRAGNVNGFYFLDTSAASGVNQKVGMNIHGSAYSSSPVDSSSAESATREVNPGSTHFFVNTRKEGLGSQEVGVQGLPPKGTIGENGLPVYNAIFIKTRYEASVNPESGMAGEHGVSGATQTVGASFHGDGGSDEPVNST